MIRRRLQISKRRSAGTLASAGGFFMGRSIDGACEMPADRFAAQPRVWPPSLREVSSVSETEGVMRLRCMRNAKTAFPTLPADRFLMILREVDNRSYLPR